MTDNKALICNKKTLLFSNIFHDVGNSYKFNNYMDNYISKNLDNNYSLVLIDAPGFKAEGDYLNNILSCFKKSKIEFKNYIYIKMDTSKEQIDKFLLNNKKIVYFLMGGNPYTQFKIIEKNDLQEKIKNHNDVVIGFCAGAINLSVFSIITSDDDFETPDSYIGLSRENIVIEPHYNTSNDNKRNNELKQFANKYNCKIYCIPDESIIYFENGKKYEKGKIYYI